MPATLLVRGAPSPRPCRSCRHRRGAELLVMGAYSHIRIYELILGGATRHLLGHADLPLLMAH